MVYEQEIALLGGTIQIVCYDLEDHLGKILAKDIENEGLRLQKIFNIYDEESELSQLNRSRREKVSKELLEVLKEALVFSKLTKGAYDVSWGMTILKRKAGDLFAQPTCSYKDIKIEGDEVIITHDDALIDLGSIAKGYIADRLGEFLNDLGIRNALIDVRGDIKMIGEYPQRVDIENPEDPTSPMGWLVLHNAGVATSNDTRQPNHLLGAAPKASATVIAKKLMHSDVLATCLAILGDETGEKLLKEYHAAALYRNDQGLVKTISHKDYVIEVCT